MFDRANDRDDRSLVKHRFTTATERKKKKKRDRCSVAASADSATQRDTQFSVPCRSRVTTLLALAAASDTRLPVTMSLSIGLIGMYNVYQTQSLCQDT